MSKIKKNIKSLKGFTLLELIVVIAIISVLLMIIVPNMTDYIRTSRIREANDRAQQIYDATQATRVLPSPVFISAIRP